MDLGMFTQTNNSRSNQNRPNTNNNRNAKGKSRANGDAWKRDATCHFCGKKGHVKPDCYAYKRQQGGPSSSQQQSNRRPQANLVEQVAQLTAELAAMKASRPSSSKN